MAVTKWLALYLLTLAVFLLLDMLWLAWLARGFYRSQLGALLAPRPVWAAAVVFYLLYVAAILFFVVQPALARHSLAWAAGAGAFLGLVAYATYDLTSLAVMANWPLRLTLVDLAWGTALTATVSGTAWLMGRWFLR